MAVKVLLKIDGDATGATTAVADAESAVSGLGTGVDWTAVGKSLADKAKPLIKSGLVGAALAVGDWLAEGLQAKLEAPEGAEAKGALDKLGASLETLRDSILDPLLPIIEKVALALVPIVDGATKLLNDIMPLLSPILDVLVTVLTAVAGLVVQVLEGIGNVVTELLKVGGELMTFLTDTQKDLQTVLDNVATFFGDVKTKLDELLKPIQDGIAEIQKAIDGIFGKADDVPTPSGVNGDWGQTPVPHGGSRGFATRGAVINVYTGADPSAVVRAINRYTGDNGGQSALTRAYRGAG